VKTAHPFVSILIVLTSVYLAAARANPVPGEQDLHRRLDRLEAGVQAAEAVRAVKRLQHTYGQYLGAGLWTEASDLFTEDAVARFKDATVTGKTALRKHFMSVAGRTESGLASKQINAHLILQPIVTLGADGRTARGTWHEVAMLGGLTSPAWWKGGIYENEYVLHEGVWKISGLRYFHQYEGSYDSFGHKAPPKWDVPYHFDAAHVGVTIPQSALGVASARAQAEPGARLADLAQRVRRLGDETDVQNLQHAFGYYLDRKLWDDVADLFVANGTYEPGKRGRFTGRANIRRALDELYGAPTLKYGELFDHLNLTTVATVAADGGTARVRTTQLVMRGRSGEKAEWEVGTYENEFVKDTGVWKIKAVRYYPQMATAYDKGWGQEFTTGGPVPKPASRTVTSPSRSAAVTRSSIPDVLGRVERQLDAAIAVDAVENLNSSYGYYIDESDWDRMADTFARTGGGKEITGAGMYLGRERIRTILNLRGPRGGRSATFFTIHQLTQPVIHVSVDGQSAKARLRLFQLGGSADGSSGSWIGGVYENTAVKEDGEWKFGIQDLHHIYNAAYRTGWSKVAAPARGRGAGSLPQYAQQFPPDRPIRARQYAFPEITEPAFHYRNPVSGRMPAELLP